MRRALLGVFAGLAISGCGGVGRGDYVAHNAAGLQAIPVFPGATAGELSSSGYRERDTPDAEIAGYGTSRTDRLPRGTPLDAAYRWYLRQLRSRGWAVREHTPGYYFNATRGNAYAHVLLGAGQVDVEVDHDCLNSAGNPRCFGP